MRRTRAALTVFLVPALVWAGCYQAPAEGTVLGPAGGQASLDGARVEVPPGALSSQTLIAVARSSAHPASPPGTSFSHGVFALTPHGQTFAQAVTVRVPGEAGERLLTADPGGSWRAVEGATFEEGMQVAQVRHFSYFSSAASDGGPPGAGRLFFSDGAALRAMNADGGSLVTLVPGAQPANYLTGITVVPSSRQVYWTDNSTDRISRVSYDGRAVATVYTSDNAFSNPQSLVVDAQAGRLFWAEGGAVRSADLAGGNVTTLVPVAGSAYATSVAVDPAARRLYWTDNGTDTLNRADYSGANRAVLRTNPDPLSNPTGLAIDVTHRLLFWAEGASVLRGTLDGTQVTAVVAGTPPASAPTAVAVDPGLELVYWTDNGSDTLSVVAYTGGTPRVLFQNPDPYSNPQGVAVDPGL